LDERLAVLAARVAPDLDGLEGAEARIGTDRDALERGELVAPASRDRAGGERKQRLGELADGGEALRGIPVQSAQDHGVEARGQRGHARRRRLEIGADGGVEAL